MTSQGSRSPRLTDIVTKPFCHLAPASAPGSVSGAGAGAVVSWSELLHWPWMGTTLVIITALTTSTGNHFLNFTLPFTVHTVSQLGSGETHTVCVLNWKENMKCCWYTVYLFIGHLLTEKFLIGCQVSLEFLCSKISHFAFPSQMWDPRCLSQAIWANIPAIVWWSHSFHNRQLFIEIGKEHLRNQRIFFLNLKVKVSWLWWFTFTWLHLQCQCQHSLLRKSWCVMNHSAELRMWSLRWRHVNIQIRMQHLQHPDYKRGGLLLLINMSGYTGADSHGHTRLHNEII